MLVSMASSLIAARASPIVYAAALANGMSPESVFIDAPHEIIFGHQIYRPQNYGGRFSNQSVTLREGVVRSLNVVVVDAAIHRRENGIAPARTLPLDGARRFRSHPV